MVTETDESVPDAGLDGAERKVEQGGHLGMGVAAVEREFHGTALGGAERGECARYPLIGQAGIDLAFVCCGDFYTMGVDDALEAVKLIQPKALVPIHHSTFGAIAQDAQAFCDRAQGYGVKGYPLKPGEILEF